MDASTLIAAYPYCWKAVLWCEVILDVICEGETETAFSVMRRAEPSLSLDRAVECIKYAVGDPPPPECVGSLQQMDHPSFRNYVRAKMGMM